MREQLLNPFTDKTDKDRVTVAIRLAEEMYLLHEHGRNYEELLERFSELVGEPVNRSDVRGAFGSIDSDEFARQMLLDPKDVPTDLSEPEMLELLERIRQADGDEFQIGYWLNCLAVNTGDERISDLIYWPGEYFEDGNNCREMSSREILDVAMAAGKSREGPGGGTAPRDR